MKPLRCNSWLRIVAVGILCSGLLATQSGPPELAGQDRDPFIPHPLERKPSRTTQGSTAAATAADAKRSREDSSRLVELTAHVHKAIEAGGQHISDARTARWLEEIEKTARRMRKRIAR